MNMYRRVVAFGATLLMLVVFLGTITHRANAQQCHAYRKYFPLHGSAIVGKKATFHYVTFRFGLEKRPIRELRCIDKYLEIDFELKDFKLLKSWEDYRVFSNLPGATKDTPWSDTTVRPSITNISTRRMRAGRLYYATIAWHARTRYKRAPAVRISWSPSYWATPGRGGPVVGWSQVQLCRLHGNDPKWCIFGNSVRTMRMWDSFFPGAKSGGWLLFRNHSELRYDFYYKG